MVYKVLPYHWQLKEAAADTTGSPRNYHLYFFAVSFHDLPFKDLFQNHVGYIVILLNLLWVNKL